MSRRKLWTVEEEEEFQRNKRERNAKSQAERREAKQIKTKKNCQYISNNSEICPNVTQTSTSFSENIVINSQASTSLIKVVYSANETVTTVSQAINTLTVTNVFMIKNNKEVNTINDGMKMFNVSYKITQNTYNLPIETLLNNNIISSIPSTSTRLMNIIRWYIFRW